MGPQTGLFDRLQDELPPFFAHLCNMLLKTFMDGDCAAALDSLFLCFSVFTSIFLMSYICSVILL